MRISIFGLGYVGAVSTACLAGDGHDIVGVDVDPTKLDMIRRGDSPVIEEGLPELMKDGVRRGKITVTEDPVEAVLGTEALMICVGTPSRRDGSLDLAVLRQVCAQIGAALGQARKPHLVIVRSTVLPGTVENTVIPILEQTSKKTVGGDFEVCFNPEFLREGSSIRDFYEAPFTVIGAKRPEAVARVREIYGSVKAPFVTTSVEAAEMIKCACNSFHALKIVFANEIGILCKGMGIDSHEVMRILCMDTRLNISTVYLEPGFAFGGSCLPKDLRALDYQASNLSLAVPMLRAILPSNQIQIERAVQMVLDTGRKSVGLLGLSFKPGTDDLRESPLVALAERLLGKGINLRIHDESVSLARLMGANKRYIEHEIPHLSRLMVGSLEDLFRDVDVVVVGKRTAEYAEAIKNRARRGQTVLDLVRIDPSGTIEEADYNGICW